MNEFTAYTLLPSLPCVFTLAAWMTDHGQWCLCIPCQRRDPVKSFYAEEGGSE